MSSNQAVIYARYSSDNQRDESIDAQVRACEDYAKRHSLEVIKIYADKAKSATSDKRPEFQKMIQDSSCGLFDVLIVHKLDRFSRDKYDSTTYKRRLKKNGVRLLSVTENLDGSPESIILESLLEGMSEYYSKNLAREVMKGLKENALSCRHTGGRPPLGFDVDPQTKLLRVNELEAIIIRQIFSMYNEGHGYGSILKRLNGKGYKTKLGSTFGKNSLYEIINNEKYCGTFVFNKKSGKSLEGSYNSHLYKSENELIRIEGGCPAIISKEDFMMAKERAALNKRGMSGSYKAKETYLLSGLIRCGCCGHAMQGNRRLDGKNKEHLYISYRCGNKVNKHQCNNKEIRKEDLEDFIIYELEKKLFSYIPSLVTRLNEYRKKNSSKYLEELDLYKRNYEEVQNKINNILNAVSLGFINESFKGEITRLESEKALLENTITELRCQENNEQITEQMLRDIIPHFHKFVKEKNIPECKKFIEHYVDEVIVYSDRVEVKYAVADSLPEAV